MEDLRTIVCGCRQGDERAFTALVGLYQNTATGYAFSLLGDFHLAQDVAQEAFLCVSRDIGTLQEPGAFPAWLRKIVFKYSDRVRRRKHFPSVDLDKAAELADRNADPADVFLREHDRATRDLAVATALHTLSESDRTVVALFYMGDHSVDEIAVFLQLSPSAVKKRLQRARERLKERMLKMVGESLTDNAPSKSMRFAEAAALLRRTTQALEQDERVDAAWLANSFGMPGDCGWSSAWLQVVVPDEHIDAFILGRHEQAALLGEPLITIEGPQNAPVGGAYLMALYDGVAGPYEIDWYWQPRSGAVIPEAVSIPSGVVAQVTHVLFDRVGLERPEGLTMHSEYKREMPAALRKVWDARTEEQAAIDDAANTISFFWAMLLISARCVAASPSEADPPHLEFIAGVLSRAQAFAGIATDASALQFRAGTASKTAALREMARAMEKVMPIAAERGAVVNPAIIDRAYRFLDLVATA